VVGVAETLWLAKDKNPDTSPSSRKRGSLPSPHAYDARGEGLRMHAPAYSAGFGIAPWPCIASASSVRGDTLAYLPQTSRIAAMPR